MCLHDSRFSAISSSHTVPHEADFSAISSSCMKDPKSRTGIAERKMPKWGRPPPVSAILRVRDDSCCRRSFTSLARLCNRDGACDQLVRGHRSQTHLQSLADAVQSTSSASPWLSSSFAHAAIKEILELWATPQSQEATVRVLHLIYRVSWTLYDVALRETESGPAAVAVLSLQQRICILSSHRAANLPFTTTHNSEV